MLFAIRNAPSQPARCRSYKSFCAFAIIISLYLQPAFAQEPAQLTALGLHNAILHSFDGGDYKETIRLLELMKKSYPDRYTQFPYALMYAKSVNLQGDADRAFDAYAQVYADQRWARFSTLALARLAALRDKSDQAIDYYKVYLKDFNNRDYREVALEALDYCMMKGKSSEMADLALIVQRRYELQRTAQFYIARSYRMEKKDQLARSLFVSLIRKGKKDDVTSLSLAELDSIDGKNLSEDERAERGMLAVEVWNFQLARQYLEPIRMNDSKYAYYYARSLYFLGDFEGSKKAFQAAISTWPHDSMTKLCIEQYANVCLQSGDYEKALDLLRQLPSDEENTFRQVQALRALSRFSDAIAILNPYCSSRNSRARSSARFVRGRIHFQIGHYRDALNDFVDASTPRTRADRREVLLWKAETLQKMGRNEESLSVYREISNGADYFALKAAEKLGTIPRSNPGYAIQYSLCRLPDTSAEEEVRKRIDSGDLLSGLLYLHLYDDATDLLPDVSAETWKLLAVNGKDRLERFLATTQLAALGQDYATATYYSELFLKHLSKNIQPMSLPKEILQTLFPLPYKDEILKFSKERSVDPLLVMSIMKQESKFKRFARSQAFARGLMQLIPETAGRIALALGLSNFSQDQLYLPDVAINFGTKYIQDMTKEFGRQVEILAAGYNAGESNLRRWLSQDPGPETLDFFSNIDMNQTKKYVMIVKVNYEIYKRIYGAL